MSTIFVSVMTLFFLALVIAFNVATLRNLRRIRHANERILEAQRKSAAALAKARGESQ